MLVPRSLGALALATEEPHPDLLNQLPYGRNEALITKRMWKHIAVQGCYQVCWGHGRRGATARERRPAACSLRGARHLLVLVVMC